MSGAQRRQAGRLARHGLAGRLAAAPAMVVGDAARAVALEAERLHGQHEGLQ